MYSPKQYWQNREVPAPRELPGYAKEYIQAHIKGAETILDFGIGEGRLLSLYADREVTGCDIVFRDLPVAMIYYPKGSYDVVVASKVLLHILPEQIEWYMWLLGKCGDKVIVYDTIAPCEAEHNFNHDFSKIVDVHQPLIRNKDLLFWYA